MYSDPRRQYCNLRPVLMNPRKRIGHDLRVDEDHDDSLKLSLNPPGANCLQQQQQSKRSTLSLTNCLSTSLALHHSHELSRRRRSDSSSSPAESSSPASASAAAAATGPLMSSDPEAAASSCKRSISTPLGSQCSSECLTSPSTTMLHQGTSYVHPLPNSGSSYSFGFLPKNSCSSSGDQIIHKLSILFFSLSLSLFSKMMRRKFSSRGRHLGWSQQQYTLLQLSQFCCKISLWPARRRRRRRRMLV